MDVADLLAAGRVPNHLVPWGQHKALNAHQVWGNTFLFDAHSEAGMMRLDWPAEGYGGYTVMDDGPDLYRHLEAVHLARGRVLKTGLGLGCFVRMVLTKPAVTHVDVVEINPDIAAHFGADFAGDPRVTIHVADAHSWPIPSGACWDFAWHDIYCDGNAGLAGQHLRLIARFYDHCRRQGAWQLPRWVRQCINRKEERRYGRTYL